MGTTNSGTSEPAPADPFHHGIADFAQRLRRGETSAIDAITYCLDRISRYNGQLGAFEYIDSEGARTAAAAMDSLLASGTDLGPLMGVPVGIKDLFAVNGMPVTNGSLHPTASLSGTEGTIVRKLRAAGAIIIGKTATVEFALGATGINEARGTPWNPHDAAQARIPGGSSSGSAVATAAGMCAFALGTDTGGSVRIPACMNGLTGHKTTCGRWPVDGVFPLSPTLDSIGPICRNAEDAALIHRLILQENTAPPIRLESLTIGKPVSYFFESLDSEVLRNVDAAISLLKDAGVTFVDIDLPEAIERETLFPAIVPAELLSSLTVEGFESAKGAMDSVTRSRAEAGLNCSAVEYVSARRRHAVLTQLIRERLSSVDAWISPTCPFVPMTLQSLDDPEQAKRSLQASRNTQPGNIFGQCSVSLPIGHLEQTLPVGLQISCDAGEDGKLLGIAVAVQRCLGIPPLPALEDFANNS